MRVPRALVAAVPAALLAVTAHAAGPGPGFMPDPVYSSPLFTFEGFYAGVQGGGAVLSGPGVVGSAKATAALMLDDLGRM